MKPRGAVRLAAVAVCIEIAFSGAVLAAHIRPGLWITATKMGAPGVPGHGIVMLGCITPAEAASNGPPPPQADAHCVYSNVKHIGNVFSGDEVCHDRYLEGKGHFVVNYTSDKGYTGETTVNGNVISGYMAGWLAPDCRLLGPKKP